MDLFEYDRQEGVSLLCGVDEAGRGPLAGDVYAAAVILPPDCELPGLNDSKKLSAKKREALYEQITAQAVSYCVATASAEEIDRLNILQATFLAMRRAVEGLSVQPELVLVDGNRNPGLPIHTRLVVKGDATSASIAAASILAKVERDRYMERLAEEYPQYQFEKHKGYGTELHYQMLDQFGPSPIHRKSFLKNYQPGTPNPAKQRGKLGEDATAEYLQKKGYTLLERNYSNSYGEIDLIARKDDILAFVEVKTRKEKSMAAGRTAVGKSKQQKIFRTAVTYWKTQADGLRPRFDVAEIVISDSAQPAVLSITYLENALDGGVFDAYL